MPTPVVDPELERIAGRQVAINGFIAFLLTIGLAIIYFSWAIIPDAWLHRVGVTYYPDRYWAVAAPSILIMLFAYYFSSHIFMMLITTHPLDDGCCVADVDGRKDTEAHLAALSVSNHHSVPPWVDIPVPIASRLLFQPWKDKE